MADFDRWFADWLAERDGGSTPTIRDAFEAGQESMVIVPNCGEEWDGGPPRGPKKHCRCLRPRGHKGPHCTRMYPEDVAFKKGQRRV